MMITIDFLGSNIYRQTMMILVSQVTDVKMMTNTNRYQSHWI